MASTIERKTLDANEEPVDEVLQMPPSLLTCGGCQQSIGDRFFLKAIEQYWHEDCLSCDLCGCRLGEVGRRLYYKLGRKLCRRDYLRLFGQDGLCASCEKRIRAFEMTMRVRDKVYHLECFKCAACQKHFCVGDRYLLINSDIVCEQDIFEWTKLNGSMCAPAPSKQAIAFVRAGEQPRPAAKTSAGILATAWDWQLLVNLERQLKFPNHIVTTTLRPDVVLLSEFTKQVVRLALTVPWGDRLEEAFERKLAKYEGLVSECRQAG
ncbi:unnamed protein product [Leuciscus chuanchicus]